MSLTPKQESFSRMLEVAESLCPSYRARFDSALSKYLACVSELSRLIDQQQTARLIA